jgi:DNA-binding MarR family transcriptional regulator
VGTTQNLAQFRYKLRKFLRFSEKAARACGVTPQQHQMMLGVAGFTGRGSATISELAEFLQERHSSVVGLVERAAARGLVRRDRGTTDRRFAVISLTDEGEEILSELSELHAQELKHARTGLIANSSDRPRSLAEAGGKGRPTASKAPTRP